jgi:cytochrome c peroxidase
MATRKITIIAVAFAALMSAGCAGGPRESGIDRRNLQRFGVLPEAISNQAGTSSAALVSLGRMLYFDARLSKSQTVSCNSCHPLDKYGADGQPTSTGYRGQHGERNSPTVYNAATQFVQFWDGRAPNVEEQAKGPLLNPVEMAMPSGKAVVDVLKSMPQYVAAFRRAFPGERNPVTFNHAAEAIGAFERGLLTPARWDQYLRGEEAALTAREKGGLTVFMQEGSARSLRTPNRVGFLARHGNT